MLALLVLSANRAVAARHRRGIYAAALPMLARAAAATGDLDLLDRLTADVPEALPIAQHALATVRAIRAERAGEHVNAASLYANSAERWRRFTGVLEEEYALLGLGRCLTVLGDPAADQPLREARGLFGQMGARPRIADCDALIIRAGQGAVRPGP